MAKFEHKYMEPTLLKEKVLSCGGDEATTELLCSTVAALNGPASASLAVKYTYDISVGRHISSYRLAWYVAGRTGTYDIPVDTCFYSSVEMYQSLLFFIEGEPTNGEIAAEVADLL